MEKSVSAVLQNQLSVRATRALASTRDVIDRYFALLEETLLENELKDCPCQIFNMDESGNQNQ